jgi:hypothetical protein
MIILTVIPLWVVLVLAFESWSPKPRALARGSPTLAAALSEHVHDGRNYSNFSEQQRLDAEISLPAHSVCEKQEKKICSVMLLLTVFIVRLLVALLIVFMS